MRWVYPEFLLLRDLPLYMYFLVDVYFLNYLYLYEIKYICVSSEMLEW